ncbi:hypothetical protein ACFVYV_40585 [Streptomyces mirabilis]|jgi:hypothetical protein|uniref:hypothetical protein n=1 Tax=Streptomyces mirabilis TaxID=68239 RepID=UPI0036DCDBE1
MSLHSFCRGCLTSRLAVRHSEDPGRPGVWTAELYDFEPETTRFSAYGDERSKFPRLPAGEQ